MVTFLRDPVQRVISNYNFLRSGSPVESYSARAIEAATEMNLKEFLMCDDPKVRMVTENFQAKALASDIRAEHRDAILDLEQQANRNLNTFDFVGIVEHFEESVEALSCTMGIILPIRKLNVTDAKPGASAEEIELIRNLNRVDLAIYNQARNKFERAVLQTSAPGCL